MKGTLAVRIELELDDDRVILSDFDAWHYVLNGWFLSLSEKEEVAFYKHLESAGVNQRWPYPEPFHSRVVSSWQRIFDLKAGNPEWLGSPFKRSIQATFRELKLSQVRSVDRFTTR